MVRFLSAFVAVMIVCLAGAFGVALVQNPEPPGPLHAAPADARVAIAPLPLAATGGEDISAALEQWIEGVVEGERIAEAERLEAARRSTNISVARTGVGEGGGDCAALAAQFGLPESILWRESRCGGADVVNSSGCGGRGCVGPSQLDRGHFNEVSPWGGTGGCSDLDPGSIDGQAECTRRLSRDGTRLDPWR